MDKFVKSSLNLEKIDGAIVVSAFLVKNFGDSYLPIFRRLQKERALFLEDKRDKALAAELALAIEDLFPK